jgi:parallel beta-helix repeat protein
MRTSTSRQIRLWLFSFICAILLPLIGRAANVTVDCSGGTPGAFTSWQAAIDSLDLVGPHQITVAPHPCQDNVQIVNRQRLTIIAPNGNGFIDSAVGAAGDAMTISGSTGITLILPGFRGGSRGVLINRNSQVAIHGTTIEMNAGAGIRIESNSTLEIDGLIQNNGGAGINAFGSTVITGGGTQFLNNGGPGIYMHRSRGAIHGNTIQGNDDGIYLANGSFVEVDAPTVIQNNRNTGVTVFEGSSAEFYGSVDSAGAPVANMISENPIVGLSIVSGAVTLFGANEISNNGSSIQPPPPHHMGVAVDFNSSFITVGSGDIKITGNTGPGIEATTGGNVRLIGTVVTSNTGNGVRLRGNGRLAIVPPNTNTLSGNGARPVDCDRSSVFIGNPTGLGEIECLILRYETL